MKAALAIALFVASMGLASGAHAAADWTEICATVGHFAGLLAAERDQQVPADAAVNAARRILDQPWMLSDAVSDEIARQVYGTPRRSPAQENASLRTECLTPPANPPGAPARPAHVVVLAPIELNVGSNHVTHFAPDGHDANITLQWHDDGNGHGYDVFTVIVAGAGPVVMPSGGDTLRDDPAHDRDMRSSVRFARGRVDGADAALLLTASRQPGNGPTPTLYRVFKLHRQDASYRFVPVLSRQLAGSCNADMALSVAAGLPLRRSYRGPLTANGCSQAPQVAHKE